MQIAETNSSDITPYSEEYLRQIEELRAETDFYRSSFGTELLRVLERYTPEDIQYFESKLPGEEETKFEELFYDTLSDLDYFWIKLRTKVNEEVLYKFLDESLNNPNARKFLEKYFPHRFCDGEIARDDLFNDVFYPESIDKFPLDLRMAMTKAHEEVFAVRQERFLEFEFTPLLLEVKSLFKTAIENGLVAISYQDFVSRLDEIEFYLHDVMLGELSENSGEYVEDVDTILLTDDDDPKFLKRTLIHEILHAISGKTCIRADGIIQNNRIGLATYTKLASDMEDMEDMRLDWLNEGVTEYLTLEIIGDSEDQEGIYRDEMDLLKLFLTRIPLGLFVNAYFEDSNPDESGPDMEKLFDAFNEKCGEGFIEKFDQDVYRLGLDSAVAYYADYARELTAERFIKDFEAKVF